MTKKNLLPLLVLVIISFYTTGCSTVAVPISVPHPAEINMSKYKQIAIGKFTGNMGQLVSDGIKNKLVESGKFKVVDRTRMTQIMSELKLSQSNLLSSKNRVKLGKLLGVSALITGYNKGSYKENVTSEEATCINSDGQKYSCTRYKRTGTYITNGSIDVIDIETGQLIRSKVLNSSYEESKSQTNKKPEHIDKESLAGRCIQDDVSSFLKAIIPWKEIVYARFIKDRKIPSLEMGINQTKLGEMDKAIKTFASAAKAAEINPELKPKNIANAYWNLGLAYQYTWNFDKAISTFKKAFTVNPKDMYIYEMKNVEKMKVEKKKLDQQNEDF